MSQADEPELDELKRLLRRLERVQSEDRHSARPVDFLEELSAALEPRPPGDPGRPPGESGDRQEKVSGTAELTPEPGQPATNPTDGSEGKQRQPDLPRHLDRRLWDMPDPAANAANTGKLPGHYPPPAIHAGSRALVRGAAYDDHFEPSVRTHRVAIIAAVCSAVVTAPLAVGLTAYLIRPELLDPVLSRIDSGWSTERTGEQGRSFQSAAADAIATRRPGPESQRVSQRVSQRDTNQDPDALTRPAIGPATSQKPPASKPETGPQANAEAASGQEAVTGPTARPAAKPDGSGLTSEIRQVAVKAIMSAMEPSGEVIPAGMHAASGTGSIERASAGLRAGLPADPPTGPALAAKPEKVATRVEPLVEGSAPAPAEAAAIATARDGSENTTSPQKAGSTEQRTSTSATRIMPPEELEPVGPAVEVIANLPDGRVANDGNVSRASPRAGPNQPTLPGPLLEAPDRLDITPGRAQALPLRLVDPDTPAADAGTYGAFFVEIIDVPDTLRILGGEQLSDRSWRISAESLPDLQIVTTAPFLQAVTLRLQLTGPDGAIRHEHALQLRPKDPS